MEKNPEVERRNAEIYKLVHDLTELEIFQAKLEYARIKWHRLNTSNPSMQAKNSDDKINIIK